jgi:hypothetical protein
LCDRTFGSPKEGISIGPIKFSQRAELLNARMAMIGYTILAYAGYNQVLLGDFFPSSLLLVIVTLSISRQNKLQEYLPGN